MFCKNCGKEIADGSKFCTQCGYRTESAPDVPGVPAEQPVAPAVPVVEQPVVQEVPVTPAAPVAEQPVVQEVPVTPVAPVVEQPVVQEVPVTPVAPVAEQPVVQEAPVTPAAPVAEQPVVQEVPITPVAPVAEQPVMQAVPVTPVAPVAQEKPKKKKTGMIVLASVGAVVIAAALLIVFNLSALANFAKKTFSSPDKYYQWVEMQNVKDASGLVSNVYGDIHDQLKNMFNMSSSGEYKFELGEAGQEMLSMSGFAGVDTSWFKDATLKFDASTKDNAVQANLALLLGKDQLASIDMIEDMKDGFAIYMAIPELSKTYLGIDMEEMSGMDMDYMTQYFEFIELIAGVIPEDAQVEKLINKYGEIALGCIDDVEMKNGRSLRAEGITEKCTELTVTIDADTLQKIAEAVIEELLQDKEVEKIIYKVCEGLAESDFEDLDMEFDMEAEEVYESFIEGLESAARNTDEIGDYEFEFEMEVFVDGKGNIRGRSFEIGDEWDTVEFSVIAPHKGKDFGYKASIVYDGEEVAVAGTGKDSGKKISGEFAIQYNGASICDIIATDFNIDEIKKGYLNGNFVIKPSSGINRVMDMSSVSSMLSELEVEVDCKTSKKSMEFAINVRTGEDDWGTLSMKATQGSGKKVSIPSGKKLVMLEDEDSIEDYWDTIDWDKFLDKLNETDLPSEFVDMIEEFAEMDIDDLVSGMSFGGYDDFDIEW